MNKSQISVLGLAAISLAAVLLFPPYDQHSIANVNVAVFSGFYFFLRPPQYGMVNGSMLLLESFVVLINAAIFWLLLREKSAVMEARRPMGYQSAALAFAAINLIVIVLFPPFESAYAVTNAALPSFEGFYFLFGHRPNHVIVTTLLYLEVMFVLVNAALAWLIFGHRKDVALSPAEAQALALELRRGRR